MYRRLNKTTDAVLKKFFKENLEELNIEVLRELELLRKHPTKRGIYMSIIDLHKQFSHYIGKINAFKHHPTFRRMFSKKQLVDKLYLTYFELIEIDSRLADGIITSKNAVQKISQASNKLITYLQPIHDVSIRSNAA